MAKKSLGNLVGSWAFLIGVLLAIISGILMGLETIPAQSEGMTIALIIVGLLVGLFNITREESNTFLMSGIVLILASLFGISMMAAIPIASGILVALLTIFIPATIIVAVKNMFNMSKN